MDKLDQAIPVLKAENKRLENELKAVRAAITACRQAEGTVTVERCLHQRDEGSPRLKGRGGRSGKQGVRISVATPD